MIRVTIDEIDNDLLNTSWCLNNAGYLTGTKNNVTNSLHRIILERKLGYPIPEGYVCDHIDRNKLNNIRNNLRLMPKYARNWNAGKPKTDMPTSKYKGVYYHKISKKYMTRIKISNRCLYLGIYENEIIAALVYDDVAREVYGDFANGNFTYY